MYELIRAGEHTYYVASPSNVGIYVYGENKVCLIDGGSDKDAAKKVLKHIEQNGWTLETVINTHSHADHSGGNALLCQRTGCRVYAPGAEAAIVKHSFLEPVYLFGGFSIKELHSKFITAPPCECEPISAEKLPQGIEYIHIDGHSFEQIAIKTDDGVWFVADSVVSGETLQKYKISFLYDIEEHLKTLDRLQTLEGRLFVPAHCEPVEDIAPLARKNRENVMEVAQTIKELCRDGLTIDELLEKEFERFGIKLYLTQYALIGFTTRSYLSWLCNRGEMAPVFEGTKLLWKTV